MSGNRYVLTVIGKDRPGIIAQVTGILFRSGCNLEDINMGVLEGEFAMVLIVQLPRGNIFQGLRQTFAKAEKKWGLEFFLKPFAVKKPLRGQTHTKSQTPYLISAIGRDRTGIVHHISQLLAAEGLNITDLNSKILGRGKKTLYSLFLEVDIPQKIPLVRLERDLKSLERKLGIEIKIRAAEAFVI